MVMAQVRNEFSRRTSPNKQLNCKTKCLIDCQLNGWRLYRFIDRFHRLNYCPSKLSILILRITIKIHSIFLIRYESHTLWAIVDTLKAHSWMRYKIPMPFKLRFKHLTMVPLPMIPITAAADADIALNRSLSLRHDLWLREGLKNKTFFLWMRFFVIRNWKNKTNSSH